MSQKFTLQGRVVEIDFVPVPAGKFLMGSPPDEPDRLSVERQHEVTISKPFLMSRYPITKAQYAAATGIGPSSDLPVVDVSWFDAAAFCEKLSAKIGKAVRLPTEAEWEYACRAGTAGPTYGPIDEIAWHRDNCVARQLVGLKKPNTWGLHDMLGNVREWCSDCYGEYPEGPSLDPQGPSEGEYRVLRGEVWYKDPPHARAANRYWYSPGARFFDTGFRVVLGGD